LLLHPSAALHVAAQTDKTKESPVPELALLLEGARQGDREAVDQLFAALYTEFRQIAHARLRKSAPLTLVETTVLVNESYLRLVRTGKLAVNDRVHFLAYAARVMRSIIVDSVRERMAQRRGCGHAEITLNTAIAEAVPSAEAEIIAVSEALEALEKVDPRLVQVVELRYFAGLTETEVAAALDMGERTVRRQWEKARVLLSALLRDG
jgi:RNA polymerase sigma factor (TIGR02999 family)